MCHRFSEVTHTELSTLATQIQTFSKSIQREILIKSIIEMAKNDQNRYGYNYWKSILIIQCCEDQRMYNFLHDWNTDASH